MNSGLGAVLFDWGLGWAEDSWGIPTGKARDEADRLRLTWIQSKQYRDLFAEFERLLDRVRAEVSPMFRGRLALAPVYRAVNLVTKIRSLDAFLLGSEDWIRAWVTDGKKLPVGRLRPTGTRIRRREPARGFWLPQTLSEWIALISGGAVLVSLAIPAVREVEQGAVPLPILAILGLALVVIGVGLTIRTSRRRTN